VPPRQFTHCVKPEDYEVLNLDVETVVGIVGLLVPGFGTPVAIGAALWGAQEVCEFISGGKLICLGGDRCAIGRVAHIEPVGFEKELYDKIDDDFSLNIVLAPHLLGEFVGKTRQENLDSLKNPPKKPQDELILEQPGMGKPFEPVRDGSTFDGYTRAFTSFPYDDPSVHPGHVNPFEVPVLHVECEGSRIHDVCDALMKTLAPFPGMEKVCSIKILGIPVGRFICTILNVAKLPLILTAVAKAWAGAKGGDVGDVLEGGGTVEVGDYVVVGGRWVWDGGHSGWNELHPLTRIQKIDPEGYIWGTDFERYRRQWCDRIGEAPPPEEPGVKPPGMTPAQEAVWDAQRSPVNIWDLHPSIDGCKGPEEGTQEGTGTHDGRPPIR
jgi:hypothetical protein